MSPKMKIQWEGLREKYNVGECFQRLSPLHFPFEGDREMGPQSRGVEGDLAPVRANMGHKKRRVHPAERATSDLEPVEEDCGKDFGGR